MKHIYLNLKRFDVSPDFGGINRLADINSWAGHIISSTKDTLAKYDKDRVEFAMYFPELHILNAVKANKDNSPIKIGCQSIYRADTGEGGNFGAFTSNRCASSMKMAGCETVLIGHCEERYPSPEF